MWQMKRGGSCFGVHGAYRGSERMCSMDRGLFAPGQDERAGTGRGRQDRPICNLFCLQLSRGYVRNRWSISAQEARSMITVLEVLVALDFRLNSGAAGSY